MSITSLIDEERICTELAEIAHRLRSRITDPADVHDEEKGTLPASWYLEVYQLRKEQASESKGEYCDFEETLQCLKNNVDPNAGLRMFSVEKEQENYFFLIETETEKIVGIICLGVSEASLGIGTERDR